MATQKRVIVDIYPDGSSKVDSEGFKGSSCTLATKEIELALAGNDPGNRDDRKKPDFYATTGQQNHLSS